MTTVEHSGAAELAVQTVGIDRVQGPEREHGFVPGLRMSSAPKIEEGLKKDRRFPAERR